MLWLALHLPRLSLEACCAMLATARLPSSAPAEHGTSLADDAAAAPLALLSAHRIADANASAHARGVRTGQRRATALALVPELRFLQADAAREAQALTAVAHAALAFTPSVTVDDERTVLLEIRSSLRLFGGLSRLLQGLRRALAPLGHRVHVAAAPTALGAALLARWSADVPRDFAHGPHVTDLKALHRLLDAAPVGLLGSAREHREALQGMGLATLADLRALPRPGLARRFGPALLEDLDRARGERPDPRDWVTLPPVFDSRLELAARADNTDQLLTAAGVLLARLVTWIHAQHARVAGFTLRMRHEPRHRDASQPAHTDLTVALASPSADVAHLRTLLREHLARLQLAAPTLELHLHCRQLVHRPKPSGDLFPSPQAEREGLGCLLERLRARLGDTRVQGLVTVADHRPERDTHPGVPMVDGREAAALPASSLPLHRPLWLWPEAVPLAERGGVPWLDGAPLQLLVGPERIETGWWDAAPMTLRDYFIAQSTEGMLVWIYRSRWPAVDVPDAGWFLHGRF